MSCTRSKLNIFIQIGSFGGQSKYPTPMSTLVAKWLQDILSNCSIPGLSPAGYHCCMSYPLSSPMFCASFTNTLILSIFIKCDHTKIVNLPTVATGMNAAVRATVRVGIYTGAKVFFVHEVNYTILFLKFRFSKIKNTTNNANAFLMSCNYTIFPLLFFGHLLFWNNCTWQRRKYVRLYQKSLKFLPSNEPFSVCCLLTGLPGSSGWWRPYSSRYLGECVNDAAAGENINARCLLCLLMLICVTLATFYSLQCSSVGQMVI